jgi:hypothetical protein
MKRPYQPELRDIPLTFKDCEDKRVEIFIAYPYIACGWAPRAECERMVRSGQCPRNFR